MFKGAPLAIMDTTARRSVYTLLMANTVNLYADVRKTIAGLLMDVLNMLQTTNILVCFFYYFVFNFLFQIRIRSLFQLKLKSMKKSKHNQAILFLGNLFYYFTDTTTRIKHATFTTGKVSHIIILFLNGYRDFFYRQQKIYRYHNDLYI